MFQESHMGECTGAIFHLPRCACAAQGLCAQGKLQREVMGFQV